MWTIITCHSIALVGCTAPYHAYGCKDDPKRGRKRETCLNWLGSSVPEDRAALEALPLGELRHRVEDNSIRTKWQVKQLAESAGQRLWFTPPHVGKLLSPIELLWATVKWHYKRVPRTDREGDQGSLTKLLEILRRHRDVTAYVHKPALHCRAVLLAARDGESLLHKRSAGSEEKPVLIPELLDTLVRFGREVRRGEAALSSFGKEVRAPDSDDWLSECKLTLADVGAPLGTDSFLTEAACKNVEEWRAETQEVQKGWRIFLRTCGHGPRLRWQRMQSRRKGGAQPRRHGRLNKRRRKMRPQRRL